MLEYKVYLAQDDMTEGDRVFLTVNADGYSATCKVGGNAVTEWTAERMIKDGCKCYQFGGTPVKRGDAVVINPHNGLDNEVIKCLQSWSKK